MPLGLLTLIAGLVLVFATGLHTLGWALIIVSIVIFVLSIILLVVAGIAILKVGRTPPRSNHRGSRR